MHPLLLIETQADGTQVNIRNIELLNNPGKFDDDFKFRIKFEAMAPLSEGELP